MEQLFAETETPITIEAQIDVVNREIRFRRGVYPRRVANRQMSQKQADEQIAGMTAVLHSLHRLKGLG